MALDMLDQIEAASGTGPYLFPSPLRPGCAYSPPCLSKNVLQHNDAFGFDELNEVERASAYRQYAAIFIRTEQDRLGLNLFDRNEAVSVIGAELGSRNRGTS